MGVMAAIAPTASVGRMARSLLSIGELVMR
jgi:hypothetical protein